MSKVIFRRSGRIARITLNRPEVFNAIDGEMPGALSAAVAVLCAALPTGSLVFLIAARYDILVARATAIIVVSTLLSVITLSALLSALAPAG